MAKKISELKIVIGGNMDSDIDKLFSAKSLKETGQTKNTLYLKNYAELNKLLSPKKMDLINFLIKSQRQEKPFSVTELAEKLGRHQEAISRDITSLKNLQLIFLKKIKQTVYAYPKYSKISIQIGTNC